MRTVETKVYLFDELSETAKDKARQWYLSCDTIDAQFAWDCLKDDAKTIGLNIDSIDTHKANKGSFIISAIDCAEKIIKEHGKDCETYKTASKFLEDRKAIECDSEYQEETEHDNLENEFLHDLLEDYRIMLEKDIDYMQSSEYVDENIRINEYEFTEEGNRF